MDLIDQVRAVHPFRVLSRDRLTALGSSLAERFYQPGEWVITQRDRDDSVYLLVEGSVDVIDTSNRRENLSDVIEAPHYFGEWEALFGGPRVFGIRARSSIRCIALSGHTFHELLTGSPALAKGFSTILRHNQGIFAAFERFKGFLLQSAAQGSIPFASLLPLYRALMPALHPGVNDSWRLDTGALMYAVRRLPRNITSTFAYLLVDEVPTAYRDAVEGFAPVATDARRRDVWQVMPGKNLVLLRAGDSDLVDLISCMCLYAVEAGKIRDRVARSGILGQVVDARQRDRSSELSLLASLPFSRREFEGLQGVWGDEVLVRISEIARHSEMFSIEVSRRRRAYATRRGEAWAAEVARLTVNSVGCSPADLAAERDVHIISSNTHSVTNCLNPWFAQNGKLVCEWARRVGHSAASGPWQRETDLVYAVARDYFIAFPDAAEDARTMARDCGQTLLEHTASTGIRVQLIDIGELAGHEIDPELNAAAVTRTRSPLIVNIDYAFGEQAQHIMRSLLMLFGPHVRSVNFFGKAGALQGRRGDILAPTAFVEQHSELFQPLPAHAQRGAEGRALAETLAERISGAQVHVGPMLTVDGTLLQNHEMLVFYRKLWGAIGMEMEGTHYYREIVESSELGLIERDVDLRFLYYVSDLPLGGGETLAAPMTAMEGVPPLYAITRHILGEILRGNEP